MIKSFNLLDEQGKKIVVEADVSCRGKMPVIILDDDYPNIEIELLKINGNEILGIDQESEDYLKDEIMKLL